ncbi:MAG: fatty acid desaturase family protein [Steroidobacteraceae bacterium]
MSADLLPRRGSAPVVPPLSVVNREQLKELRKRSTVRGLGMVAHAWAVMVLCAVVATIWPNPFTIVLAIMIIGSRQLGLLYLVHEGAHGTLTHGSRLNLFVSQWFCAYPMLACSLAYRRTHLVHHVTTLQPDDPDLHITADYPMTRKQFARVLLQNLSGVTFLRDRRKQIVDAWGPADLTASARLQRLREKIGRQLLANAILLGLCAAAGHAYMYLLFWLLPMATWQQAMRTLLSLAAHAVVSDPNDPCHHARTTVTGPIGRVFVFPYYSNYHLDHHIISYAPCYHMPRLHRLLKASPIGSNMEIETSLLQVVRLVTSARARTSAAA